MGGLRRSMPWTFALMVIATLAISGVPPFSGFFSKDEILGAAFARGAGHPIYLVCWALGLAAALMTAFYMARLVAMTFLGRFRGGEQAEEHLHEAPWIMTGPLVVLGVLSLVGGVVNLPAFVGGTSWLERWLAPVTQTARMTMTPIPEATGASETLLIGLAIAAAVVGLAGGWWMTTRSAIATPERSPAERGFWRVVYHKYYVDELYQRVFVNPVVWLSRRVLWQTIDALLVDRIGVGGTARLAEGLGWLGSQAAERPGRVLRDDVRRRRRAHSSHPDEVADGSIPRVHRLRTLDHPRAAGAADPGDAGDPLRAREGGPLHRVRAWR